MAKTTDPTTVVVLDDELSHVQWLLDYLVNQGFEVFPCSSADEAIDVLSREVYRAAVLDLNVPLARSFSEAAKLLGAVYQRYPGLYVAKLARDFGYRDRQVIIYSVHRDPEVSAEAKKLGCTYILKGRPIELKDELTQVLAYDPTDPSE